MIGIMTTITQGFPRKGIITTQINVLPNIHIFQ